MMRTICFGLFIACVPLPALADQMTAADLQLICSGTTEDTQNACRFFILGVVEGATGFGTGTKLKTGPLCIAPDIPDKALVVAVKKWMQVDLIAYPEDKSLSAAGFVVAAAMEAYPCKKSN
jgi:Rap1a immunity proteins